MSKKRASKSEPSSSRRNNIEEMFVKDGKRRGEKYKGKIQRKRKHNDVNVNGVKCTANVAASQSSSILFYDVCIYYLCVASLFVFSNLIVVCYER